MNQGSKTKQFSVVVNYIPKSSSERKVVNGKEEPQLEKLEEDDVVWAH